MAVSTRAETIAGALAEKLAQAWNAADGAAFGAQFAEDAQFVDIRGGYHQTRDVIARAHQGIFDTIYRGSSTTFEVEDARRLAAGVILAHMRAVLNAPAGPLAGENEAVQTVVLVEEDGAWRIAAFHNTLVLPPPN